MYHTGFVRVNGPYYRCESNEPQRMCEVNETYTELKETKDN